jgi:hypothetical protein
MQGCLPSNPLNAIKVGSTMCTKLAQVSQNPSFLMWVRMYIALLMGVVQNVDKSCLFKVSDSLFNNKSHFQQPFNYQVASAF